MSDLSFGMRGPEVGNLQRFLNTTFFVPNLVVDEDFGNKTRVATAAFQSHERIPLAAGQAPEKAGVFGPLTRKRAMEMGFIPFIPARNYTMMGLDKPRFIDLIVIHTMEIVNKPDSAERVAAYFAGPNAPRASAHYNVDADSIVQSVRDRDVAWHAPGGNSRGIGIEHSGYAKQTPNEWKSAYNQAMLTRSAQLVARLCREYNIPIERRTPDELKSKMRGICGHVDITNAFSKGVGHWDPGPSWLWNEYIALIEANS